MWRLPKSCEEALRRESCKKDGGEDVVHNGGGSTFVKLNRSNPKIQETSSDSGAVTEDNTCIRMYICMHTHALSVCICICV